MFKFESKRSLRERIALLESERNYYMKLSELSKETGLEKCKGQLCKCCGHAVFYEDEWHYPRVIGCDLECSCKDFSRKTKTE